MQNKISAIVAQKLPDFIQNDYQLFALFIKYYFEWMETEDMFLEYVETYRDNIDLDRADEEFLDRFICDFAEQFPKNYYDNGTINFTKVELTKAIREFYVAKGSEASFRFIFTILYNTDIDFFYPREVIQNSSNAVWDSIDFLYSTAENYFKLDIKPDSNIFAQGVTSGKALIVDKIVTTYSSSIQVMNLSISSYEPGFIIGEEIEITVDNVTITETIIGVLDEINVIDGGTDYTLEDTVEIVDSGNGINALAKIANIDTGGFDSYTIANAGTGYTLEDIVYVNHSLDNNGFGFVAIIKEIGGSGEIVKLQIINNGEGYSKTGTAKISTVSGSNAVITFNGSNIGKITKILVYDSGIGYTTSGNVTVNITSGIGTGLTTEPVTSAIFTGVFRHENGLDFPSNYSRLQDSYLYQKYSYVVKSSISPHLWLDQIKRVVHPAGTIVFGMYVLESYVEAIISIPLNRPPLVSVIVNLEGVSANSQVAIAGIHEMVIYFPVSPSFTVDLLQFDLDNTKLENTWGASEYDDYSLDTIIARELQESKQEDHKLDLLSVYNAGTTYTIGQQVLFTDGNVYENLLGSTGIAPPDIANWEIKTYTQYNNETEYALNDAVFDGTNTYIYTNVAPSTGNAPPNVTYWDLV